MIIFGSRLFGKVDAVPGLGHVATKFFHINYLPLIPLEGWFVTGQSGKQWQGRAIPMSAKSVLVAWLRFGLFCAGIAFTLFGAIALSDQDRGAVPVVVMGVSAIAGFIGTYLWGAISRAGLDRALELAGHLEATPEGMEQIRQRYATRGE